MLLSQRLAVVLLLAVVSALTLDAHPAVAASAENVQWTFAASGTTTDGWSRSAPASTPDFSLVGFEVPEGAVVRARSGLDDGAWSEWTAAFKAHTTHHHDEDHGQPSEQDGFTEPVWVNQADRLQVEVLGAPVEQVTAHLVPVESGGFSAAATCQTDKNLPTGLPYVSRTAWGAEAPQETIEYADDVTFGVIHHTAGSNTYTSVDGCAIVSGIQRYHMHSRGWADIGYNLLVDRFGRVYEGRAGGLAKTVIGAHAAGYNTGSFGVAAMGEFTQQAVSSSLLSSLVDVVAWKYTTHGIDPSSDATTTRGGETLPTLVGHRDVGSTACPGQKLYDALGSIRAQVEAAAATAAVALSGDWDGDGVDDVGWYRDGKVRLRLGDGTVDNFFYGTNGDVPVTGDWDGDGIDTIGVVRGNRWLLRNSNTGGNAQVQFWYGNASDTPVVGDWNGDTKDTPGLFRGGRWILTNQLAGTPELAFWYGKATDTPVTGDWNGDTIDTPGLFRGGRWILTNQLAGTPHLAYWYGASTDLPVTGDWNNDNAVTAGAVRDHALFLLNNSHTGGGADLGITLNAP